METANEYAKAAKEYYEKTHQNPNDREMSWEHCYYQFAKAIDQNDDRDEVVDYLSLHLAFYLASWGMYRGSSFLLLKDYKVHEKAVRIIFRHGSLRGATYKELCKPETLDMIDRLTSDLREHYSEIRKSVRGEVTSPISDILITKVLLGTLACVPAYDKYFMAAMRQAGVSTRAFNIESIRELADFYQRYKDSFEDVRNNYSICGFEYPQMKVLDMAFWQIGYDCG